MIDLTITKLVSVRLPLTKKEITYIAQKILDALKVSKKTSFSLVIVGDSKIRSLNRMYREKDKVTDILSFPLYEYKDKRRKEVNLGDIFLSPSHIKKEASLYGNSLKKHYTELLIHGVLHLLGYDHKTTNEYSKMNELEDRIYKKVKNYLKLL